MQPLEKKALFSFGSVFLIFLQWIIPFILLIAWLFSYPFGLVDDAYIPMVYAENIAEGHGIVFYPGGERVEGYTSPLWLFLLVCIQFLPVDAPFALLPSSAYCMGFLCAALVLWLTLMIYHRLFTSEDKIFSWNNLIWPILPCLLILSDIAFPAWASAGLETHLYSLFLLLLLLLFTLKKYKMSAIVLFLLALTRPEGVLFLVPIMAVIFYRREDIKSNLITFSLYFVVPLALFLLWRWFYFGYPLPNSFYAKHDYGGVAVLYRGFEYVLTYFKPRPLLLMMFLWWWLEKEENRKNGIYILLISLTHIMIVILEGGDHFALHRFMAPALPLFAILTVRSLYCCYDRLLVSKWEKITPIRLGLSNGVFLLIVITIFWAHKNQIMEYKADDRFHFSNGAQWHFDEVAWARNWADVGRWLKTKYPPETKIAVVTAGAIPYYSDLPSIDIVGINDPIIAHTPVVDPSRRHVGHEKSNPDYVLSHQPVFIQLFPLLFFSSNPYPEEKLEELLTYPAQKDLWNHPQFQQSYSYNTEKTQFGTISYFERVGWTNE